MASKGTAVKASNTHESTVTPAGSSVQVHGESGMPVMLVQAIIIAATLCVCELVCSPIYLSFTPGLFPIGSWVLVAMLLAVAFAYVVGTAAFCRYFGLFRRIGFCFAVPYLYFLPAVSDV